MAQVMPSIRVTDPQSKEGNPLERQDTGKRSTKGDIQTLKTATPLANSKLAAKTRSPATPAAANEQPAQQNGSASYSEGRRPSEAAIDPLSQHILRRTNTSSAVQKLRIQTENVAAQTPSSPTDTADTKPTPEITRELAVGANSKTDKKKGVSFLSRFIGNKRKGTLDGTTEDGSEAGDSRAEGMDAQLFSHAADNFGFSPKHPQPPAYIKVRTKFKKAKEFDRLFLAQELRTGTDKKAPPVAGANPAPQSGSAATHNPIWATEFSKDGKYMAAGGQDRIVRVWAVISTSEERTNHERDEDEPNSAAEAAMHLSAPVFQQKPHREYHGHTATILDLSWSKNNFLLSSSMDKTVRLWHVSRSENLCTFKHTDFVPSIQFHPRDDRFFLAGSLDTKLRLWSIPDKSVAYWNQLPDMITAVSFTPDGKTCIAGTLGGLCMFYETEGLKYQTQTHVKSTRGQNAKGSKITGIQATHWPPGSDSGEVKLLVSSNDSRVRLYNFRDKSLEVKFRGHENNCSQIKASFADDTGYVICGSEDRKAYIWSTSAPEGEKRNQGPLEMFEAHNSITTCAVIAPLKTRQLLSASEDPIFDLCNPPPVTLISRAESINSSSKPPTEAGSALPTPAPTESNFRKVAESPAYIARSAHLDGNIIVTADYTGALKVFRQDCAYMKRLRSSENWDAGSVFSKKAGSKLGRPSSIMSRGTTRTRRDSTSTQPPNDRIMSWRQDISHDSFDSANGSGARGSFARSSSPRKSRQSISSSARPVDSPSLRPTPTSATETQTSNSRQTSTPKTSLSTEHTPAQSSEASTPSRQPSTVSIPNQEQLNSGASNFEPLKKESSLSNPLAIYNGQSWAFWNNHKAAKGSSLAPPGSRPGDPARPDLLNRNSVISKLSSEEEGYGEEEDGMRCKHCGGEEFKVRTTRGIGGAGREERVLVCGKCGQPAD